MRSIRIVLPALALVLTGTGPGMPSAMAAPGAYAQEGGWDVPPQEFSEVQRRGFHDGVEGARHDFDNHRPPSPENRDEYRNPHVEPALRHDYREAFRRGYQTAAAHLWGGRPAYGQMAPPPPPPPPPPMAQGNWDWGMRGLRTDAQRRGFHEGVEDARRDFQMQRRADADDHPEYRMPPVPPPVADEYREGFMRGYTVAYSQLNGDPVWENNGDPNRWVAPDRYNEVQRRGFQDGLAGARHDFDNHRRPDPANRDEYRNPHVPPPLVHDYREGFRRGYEMAAIRLWGE